MPSLRAPPRSWPPSRLLAPLLAVLLLAGSGCSAPEVQTRSSPALDLSVMDTYAWPTRPPPPDSPLAEAGLANAIRKAVDARLAARGLRPVPGDQAALLLSPRVDVDVHEQVNDPYYSQFPAEQIEKGTLTLTFQDAHTREVLWEGSATLRLRRVAARVGLVAPHWAPTDNPRDWHVDTIVTALLEHFGNPDR